MRIKKGYLLREVAGNHVVVPIGNAALDFSRLITLNNTGAFLWKQLVRDRTQQELISSMLDEYAIDIETLKKDVCEFIDKLKDADLLE